MEMASPRTNVTEVHIAWPLGWGARLDRLNRLDCGSATRHQAQTARLQVDGGDGPWSHNAPRGPERSMIDRIDRIDSGRKLGMPKTAITLLWGRIA